MKKNRVFATAGLQNHLIHQPLKLMAMFIQQTQKPWTT